MSGHDIIVIGGSAGSMEPLKEILAQLPENFPASIFVVIHIPADSESHLPYILARVCKLRVFAAKDGTQFRKGEIHVGVPDLHMALKKDRILLIRGARQNLSRPAIDPLFRSAAYYYGPRVMGVLLSGSLDDGSSGLGMIKQRGGLAIVQDPEEALHPDMPRSALEHADVDYSAGCGEIARLLMRWVSVAAQKESNFPISRLLEKETRMLENEITDITDEQMGKLTQFSCPECGGVLRELRQENHVRFRCRTGHAYSTESMIQGQAHQMENALWVALKTLEESANLYKKILRDAQVRGHKALIGRFEEKLKTSEERAGLIRKTLMIEEEPIPAEEVPAIAGEEET